MIRAQHSLLLVLMAAAGHAASADDTAAPGDGPKGQPNVVIFFSDDAGYADFSMHGSRTCPTPNIDSIAQCGIHFTDGYVTASSCGPSRAGLITGRYQQRFGYYTNVSNTSIEEGGLPLAETTIAEMLRAAGYRTIALGKWHLGATEQFHPLNRGFDDFYGFLGGQRNYWPGDEKIPVYRLRKNFRTIAEDFEYFTDELARQATAYIVDE